MKVTNHQDIDSNLFDLLPHRPPMLLPTRLISVNENSAESLVIIHKDSSFYSAESGVPASIGIEYMGQTAALIAGYQEQQGMIKPHLGFLIGVRHYQCQQAWFELGQHLKISCQEVAVVGETLATFDCQILNANNNVIIAEGNLSVMRKPLSSEGEL